MVFVMDLVKGDGWISSSLGWNNCEILNKRDRRVRSNYYLIDSDLDEVIPRKNNFQLTANHYILSV